MARVLVTGGAGFVGVNFVRHTLAERDDQLTVLDNFSYAANPHCLDELLGERCRLVRGDIADAALVDELVAGSELIVNLAAETHNDRSLADPQPFLHSNVAGVASLLTAARAHGVRFHQVSTDEVFGDLPLDGEQRFTAESAYRPSSPYAASKAAGDLLALAWWRSFGVRVTISHSSNNYGPYQHVEKFIPRQITTLLQGGRIRLFGDGRQVRDWLDVDDHVRGIWAVIDRGRPGVHYLLGADCQLSNRTLADKLLQLFGRPSDQIEFVADRPGHDQRYALDASLAVEELGWRPRQTDIDAGLARTIDWYRHNGWFWEPAKSDTEAWYAQRGQ